jgi:hypothetical protein
MEFKSFMEALKGKQHKIDKNKNGKVDAHDFELLRKEETESLDEAATTTKQRTDTNRPTYDVHSKATGNRIGTIYTPSKTNPKHQTTIYDSTGAIHKRAEHDSLKDAHDFIKTSRGIKEETQLEEATVKTQKYEWGTMKTVHQGSDFSIPLHPEHHKEIAKLKDQQEHKFKTEDGKHWTAKRSGDDVHFQGANGGNSTTVKHSTMSESVEDLDEIHRMKTKLNKLDDISNKSVARQKLSNLMKSGKARGALIANKMRTLNMGDDLDQEDLDALHEVMSKDAKAGDWIHDFVHSDNPKFAGKNKKERINMALGAYYDTHKKKDGVSEEVEQIEERNKQNAMMRKTMDASRGARYKLNNPVPDADPKHKTARDHNVAIGRALRSEDKMTTTKDKNGKLIGFKYEGDWKKSTKADAKKDPAGKVANMAGQAMQKMAKANEQAPVAPVPDRKYIKGTPENKALKAARKPINGMPTNKIKEAKDEQEYGYEGDMAMNQLSTLIRCAEMIKDTLKPDTDLPEWVQSKITLASDYIVTAADYLHSELEEGYYEKPASAYRRKGDEVGGGSSKAVEVKVNHAGDEPHEEKWEPVKKIKKPVAEAVQKVDIPAYLRKAKGDTPLKMDDLKRKDTLSDAENLKRNRGVKESFDDEGNLISNKVSYKEFMLEYTPGPGGVTQIKGRSYGANYSDPEGADDADDNKPMKPAAEKRGRGRPAGAKSGARKITGTSKLMNK